MTVQPPGGPAERVSTALSFLVARAQQANLARAETLAQALDALAGSGLDGDGRSAAMRSAHQVAGSAGTFGHRTASSLARELEQFFANPAAAETGLEEARQRLAELRQVLESAPDLDGG